MLLRTHYVITLFFVILFFSSVTHKFVFVLAAIIGTQLPDIDSRYSKIGSKKIARILQLFTKHRGMIHSFTFLLSLTIILVLIWPVSAFGFFLGYGIHILADSFTIDGITPFYPYKKKSVGIVRTGGFLEKGIFFGFLIVDMILVLQKVGVF
jgi:inner membrane protein